MDDGQTKYFVFTLNNYTSTQIDALDSWVHTSCTFATWGFEIGDSGTPHLQGYLELRTRKRRSTLKRELSEIGLNSIHLERRRGTGQQASDYCHDPDKVHEQPGFFYGTLAQPEQGKRNDLAALREDLLDGQPLRHIAENHFGSFLRYQRGILAFRNVVAPQRMWPTDVQVLWGNTGVGKTRRVFQEVALENMYVHQGTQWFDGYDGQTDVLFDEYSGSYFPLPYLLKLLDRYPMQVPIKGGFVSWIPRRIWITSNYPPTEWYPNARPEHVAAMLRRITNTEHMQ